MRLFIAILILVGAIVILPMGALGVFFILAITALIFAGFIRLVAHYWDPEQEQAWPRRQFWLWIGKGLIVPLAFWILLHTGISSRLPSPLAQPTSAPKYLTYPPSPKPSGPSLKTLSALLRSAIPVAVVLGSFWAAVSLGWLVINLCLHTKARQDILGASILWCLLLSPVAALALYIGGWGGTGMALLALLVPITRELLAFGPPRKLPPLYTRALAKRDLGKYRDAEIAILRELEKREDDFDGWMLLAELYANQFHELAEAERVIVQVCAQPTVTRPQVALALNRLADWHLQLGKDPAAARRTLEEICRRFPATHLADTARQRADKISATG
jgi:hypothetical protein